MTQGAEGLLAMTVPQAVTVRKGTFRPHFDEAANPDPATADMLRGLLRCDPRPRAAREAPRAVADWYEGCRKKK